MSIRASLRQRALGLALVTLGGGSVLLFCARSDDSSVSSLRSPREPAKSFQKRESSRKPRAAPALKSPAIRSEKAPEPPLAHAPLDPYRFGYSSLSQMESDLRTKLHIPHDSKVELWAEHRNGRPGVAIEVVADDESGRRLQAP